MHVDQMLKALRTSVMQAGLCRACDWCDVILRVMQTVDGRYTMDDYQQAIIDAGVYAQSNGTTVTSPGIGFEEVNTSAALPTTSG